MREREPQTNSFEVQISPFAKQTNDKLTPERVDEVVEKLREKYREDQPIFYRFDRSFLELVGVSHQLLNNVLTMARRDGVISSPNRVSKRRGQGQVFYWREEIITALTYAGELRQQGLGLASTAKRLRSEAKEDEKLTLRGLAKKSGIPTERLHRLIAEGKVDLGDPILTETVKRMKDLHNSKQRLFSGEMAEGPLIQQIQFADLTIRRFHSHRQFFATVSEVAQEAGIYVWRAEIAAVAQVLADSGIKIAHLTYRNSEGQVKSSCYVLSRAEKEKVVKIFKVSKELAKFRRPKVRLVYGPRIDPLPTMTQLGDRQRYLAVSPFLRQFGIKIGGYSKNRVANFFSPDSPISILKLQRGYYFPVYQEGELREFIQRNRQESKI